MKTEEKIIMYDSDEVVKKATHNVFITHDGYAYFDEQSARYSGCTHVKCDDCDNPTPKGRLRCDDCVDKSDIAKWMKREEKEWDGKTCIYSESNDEYFCDADDLEYFLDEQDERPSLESLRLVICEPKTYWPIDPDDIYTMPEDMEICDEIFKAFEELNEKIKACKEPICWIPGKFRPSTASVLKAMGCGE